MPIGRPSIFEAVQTLIATTADWISANPDAARCIFRFRGALESAGSSALKEHNRTELSPLLKRLTGWIENGDIRALPMALLLPLLHGPMHEYARAWLAGRTPVPPKAYVEVFVASAWAALKP